MAVSVIISNFNGLHFLPRLIESLKAQVGVEIEIIIVDRKSTDGSLECLSHISDIQVVTEAPETGLVAGYHAGTKYASKEHYFFCNEDMWFDPHCLARLEGEISIEEKIVAADPWQWDYEGGNRIHAGTRIVANRFSLNSPASFLCIGF